MPFERRWSAVLKACGRENEVFGWHTLVFSEALFDLITHPKVLDILEVLIGSDIQFNGDFWVRPKLPNEKLTTLPWHQDSAYMPDTENDIHLTVWLPLVDVKVANGPLQFIPGSHKSGLHTYHRVDGEAFAVPVLPPTSSDSEIDTLEMQKGDLLVFNNLVFHRSLVNRSNTIRWSTDFRFSPIWHLTQRTLARSDCVSCSRVQKQGMPDIMANVVCTMGSQSSQRQIRLTDMYGVFVSKIFVFLHLFYNNPSKYNRKQHALSKRLTITSYRHFWQHIGGSFVKRKNYYSYPQRTADVGHEPNRLS